MLQGRLYAPTLFNILLSLVYEISAYHKTTSIYSTKFLQVLTLTILTLLEMYVIKYHISFSKLDIIFMSSD